MFGHLGINGKFIMGAIGPFVLANATVTLVNPLIFGT